MYVEQIDWKVRIALGIEKNKSGWRHRINFRVVFYHFDADDFIIGALRFSGCRNYNHEVYEVNDVPFHI
jgi:hypothetical protein